MKRSLSLLLCLLLCLANLPALADGYVTEWDLTQLYEDQAAFDAEYAAAQALLPGFDALRGTLSTPEGMRASALLDSEINLMVARLTGYADFLTMLDISDPRGRALTARVRALAAEWTQAKGFISDEIGAMTIEERKALVASPELADFAYALRSVADEKTAYLSEETNRVLAILGDALLTTDNVYATLLYGDLPNPVYTTPDGEELTLDSATFTGMVYDGEPRERLIEMAALRTMRYKPYENTFAACLDAHVRTMWDYARLNQFDSTLAYALHKSDLDPAIYTMLVDAAHEGLPDYRRYNQAVKRSLGLEGQDMYGFDAFLPMTDYQPEKTFDESADDVLDALSIFGDEYTAVARTMLTTGHVDAFPAENKDTGAYSIALDGKVIPFITMNYMNADSASVLAHELGHSLYSYFSGASQPAQYVDPSSFTHEVASTVNEVLYYRTMYDRAESDDERLFYLQKQIDLFTSSFFSQAMYAEFEDFCYKTVEGGGALLAADLNAEFSRLRDLYDGDTYVILDGAETGWCAIPHFYYDYYVFNYASSICYASAVADRLYSGAAGAKEDYMRFLSLGGSVSPTEALAVAGVDPLNKSTYDDALHYFKEMLDQYEVLIARRSNP